MANQHDEARHNTTLPADRDRSRSPPRSSNEPVGFGVVNDSADDEWLAAQGKTAADDDSDDERLPGDDSDVNDSADDDSDDGKPDDGWDEYEEFQARAEKLADPWSGQRYSQGRTASGSVEVCTMEVRKMSGELISNLSGLGPDTSGDCLQDMIAKVDHVHPIGKKLLLDTDEVAVYDRLGAFSTKTNVLTVVYTPILERLTSEEAEIRERAVWAVAKAKWEELKDFVTRGNLKVLARMLQSPHAGIRETSGALESISHILELGRQKWEERKEKKIRKGEDMTMRFEGEVEDEDGEDSMSFDEDNPFHCWGLSEEVAHNTRDALRGVLSGGCDALNERASQILEEQFGEAPMDYTD